MKLVDLHVHSKISKKLPLAPARLEQTIARAIQLGLDGFAVTEHFHAERFWHVHETLLDRYPYRDGAYEVGVSFRILSGAEVGVVGAGDVLVLGDVGELRRFDESFVRPLSADYHPEFGEFVRKARRFDLILIGAHPYRPQKTLALLGAARLSALDALEVNGKDYFSNGLLGANEDLVRRLACRAGLPVVASSDAHLWPQVGVLATRYPVSKLTFDEFRRCLASGRRFDLVPLRHGAQLVRVAKAAKHVVKAQRSHHAAEAAQEQAVAA